ncbi:hypothetical protein ACFX2I_038829 [Malus domestica]
MSCFWAKLVLAVVATYLLVGVFPATSTLIPTDNWKKRVALGVKVRVLEVKVPIHSLRAAVKSLPTSPIENRPQGHGASLPPPLR